MPQQDRAADGVGQAHSLASGSSSGGSSFGLRSYEAVGGSSTVWGEAVQYTALVYHGTVVGHASGLQWAQALCWYLR